VDLQVRGVDVAITDDLRTFIGRRSGKLDHLVDRVVDAKLELRARHNRTGGDTTTAQLTIHAGRSVLRAEENDHDPFRAIDLAFDKMARQIRRYHEKRSDRKGPRPVPAIDVVLDEALADVAEFEADTENDSLDRKPVRTKRFSVKPMDPDEAIEQMELLAHDFFLFLNAEEQQLNVVYRRHDGSYGLLAPERS
jgi:putative sigma-54 modulation protein